MASPQRDDEAPTLKKAAEAVLRSGQPRNACRQRQKHGRLSATDSKRPAGPIEIESVDGGAGRIDQAADLISRDA